MNDIIRWEDPPRHLRGPRPRRRTDDDGWGLVARKLRAHPKRWAVIFEPVDDGSAHTLANGIRGGRYPSFHPSLSFDAVTRRRDGVTRVYARYVGEDGS